DEGMWAVGDVAAVLSGEGDTVCPQLAPVAIQSGRHCAQQIINTLSGAPTQPFHYRDKGIMATIGRRAAVAKAPKGPVIRGTLGWLAWLFLHLFYLVGFRNRVRVLINWAWRYLDWPSGPRLIVADAETED
ncbi:MAG TPA: NAD(P)/FAD-dependent oxidoreductase, partial [Acidimicrobiales bacterium]|nr:NAD(P)/FAD-dependent oxidoreductase [Acidimicrobiales bacterium]